MADTCRVACLHRLLPLPCMYQDVRKAGGKTRGVIVMDLDGLGMGILKHISTIKQITGLL